jgi:hypothetical protein
LYDAPFRIITPFNPFNPKKKYENENGNKNHQIIRSFVMMSRGELVMMIKIGKNSANLPNYDLKKLSVTRPRSDLK